MSLAKAVLSGIVYRNPEKRFTGNNIPVTSFSLNIDEKEQTLIRVIARGNMAENVESAISKGDKIVVEGRLQMVGVQTDDGNERKVLELDLSSFETFGASQTSSAPASNEVVKFSEVEKTEDLIDPEEIPF